MHKGHKVEKIKKFFCFVLLPDFSYRPFQGELIPNESKPRNTAFCETHTLSQVCSCCQWKERGIIPFISRCMYKGGYLLLSQQKLLWGSIRQCSHHSHPPRPPPPHRPRPPCLRLWQTGTAPAAILTQVLSCSWSNS